MQKVNPQTKPARLIDIAKAAGVSVSAAGTVLNIRAKPSRVSPAVADHIRQVAARLNYIPNYHARSVRSGRAETIAVALDHGMSEGPFIAYWAHLLGAIDSYCRSNEFQMTIVGPNERMSAVNRGILGIQQKRFDGLIAFGTETEPQALSMLTDLPPNMSIVVVQPQVPTRLPVIDFDSVSGVYMAVKHLAQLGHKSLLWCGPDTPVFSPLRRQAFMRAAAEHKIAGRILLFPGLRPELISPGEQPPDAQRMVDPRYQSVYQTVLADLEKSKKPETAILCYNDEVAIGVYGALAQAGLNIPRDVSVIGYDDTHAFQCIPPLTTVSHEFAVMGLEAAKRLLDMIKDPKSRRSHYGTRHTVKPRLVVRSSTAAPSR